MITIIQHGNMVNKYHSICPKCHCIFSYDDFDIKNKGSQYDPIYYIYCPECSCELTGWTREELT